MIVHFYTGLRIQAEMTRIQFSNNGSGSDRQGRPDPDPTVMEERIRPLQVHYNIFLSHNFMITFLFNFCQQILKAGSWTELFHIPDPTKKLRSGSAPLLIYPSENFSFFITFCIYIFHYIYLSIYTIVFVQYFFLSYNSMKKIR